MNGGVLDHDAIHEYVQVTTTLDPDELATSCLLGDRAAELLLSIADADGGATIPAAEQQPGFFRPGYADRSGCPPRGPH